MGGLAIQLSDNLPAGKRFVPSGTNELRFVTPDGVRHLLSQENNGRHELPNLSEEEIKSKSKASGVTKSLVCIQASWFIAQCFTRRKSAQAPRNLELIQTFLCSSTKDADQSVRAEYLWSRCLCAYHLHLLVGQALRSRFPFDHSKRNSLGYICAHVDERASVSCGYINEFKNESYSERFSPLPDASEGILILRLFIQSPCFRMTLNWTYRNGKSRSTKTLNLRITTHRPLQRKWSFYVILNPRWSC